MGIYLPKHDLMLEDIKVVVISIYPLQVLESDKFHGTMYMSAHIAYYSYRGLYMSANK